MTTKDELAAIVLRLEAEKATLFDLACKLQTENSRLQRELADIQRANEFLVTRYIKPTDVRHAE